MMKEKEEKEEKEEEEEKEEKEEEEEGGCKYSGGRTPALNQRPSVTGLPCNNASTSNHFCPLFVDFWIPRYILLQLEDSQNDVLQQRRKTSVVCFSCPAPSICSVGINYVCRRTKRRKRYCNP